MSTNENDQSAAATAVQNPLAEVEEEEEVPFEELLETAKRHYALREWAEAADGFGQALESV